jgi:hypothetical protein
MRKSGIVTKIKGAALALAVSGSFIVPAQLATATPAHATVVKQIIKPNAKKIEPRGTNAAASSAWRIERRGVNVELHTVGEMSTR